MANNRIYMYCTECMEATTIAKYYPYSWGSATKEERMERFFDRHYDCHDKKLRTPERYFSGEGCYGFVSEGNRIIDGKPVVFGAVADGKTGERWIKIFPDPMIKEE